MTSFIVFFDTALSLLLGWKRDSLEQEIPYMPSSAIKWLENHLTQDMEVFEWGSGGSTLFIAKRVKTITSVEYGKRWYYRLRAHLLVKGIKNCTLRLVLPEVVGEEKYRSQGKYGHLFFKNFVESIDVYPNESLDLILIDGRCRSQCIQHARGKVKKGGYLLIDDADRTEYASAINALQEFKKLMCDRMVILQKI